MAKIATNRTLQERAHERKRRARERARFSAELEWRAPGEAGSPVVLVDRATSVTPANPHEIPAEWWPVIDREWCHRQLGAARRWAERASAARRQLRAAERLNARWALERRQLGELSWDGQGDGPPVGDHGQDPPVVDERGPLKRARYADARARTIALERSAVVGQCGQRTIAKRCGCKGVRLEPVGCGQVILCDRCRVRYYRRVRRRALTAVTARLADAMTRWAVAGRRRGRRPQIVFLTLTVPRTVDGRRMPLAERHRRLVEGWRKFRQWLHKRIGAFPFVALPELTAGSDGAGHLHYHAICVWPWWNWKQAIEQWRRATGIDAANAPDMKVVRSVRDAAHYVAKYATKGANCDGEGMTADLVGDFVATFYGKRRILPSVGFWQRQDPPCCPECSKAIVVIERPAPTVEACAAWRARRGIAGVPAAEPPPVDRKWLQVAPRW